MAALAVGWTASRAVAWMRGARAGPRRVAIDGGPGYWREQGFTLLAPALRAPSNVDGTDVTEVWLKLPAGSTLRTVRRPEGGVSLSVPAGTIAHRVELIGGVVVDVRGTRFEAGGREIFLILRPDSTRGGRKLDGYEWPREDPRQAQTVARLMSDRVRATAGARAADRLRSLMDCAGCHPRDKPGLRRPSPAGFPNRPTDGSGLYQILAVLSDQSPLERYRPREMNLDDPFVRIQCDGSAPVTRTARSGGFHVSCADGSVPVGRLDIGAALAAGDERALGVCAARLALEGHMDAPGRDAFAEAFAACRTPRP